MKNEIHIKMIQTTILALAVFFSISAQSATCSLRSDTLADTQDLGEFVKAEMTGFKKVSLNNPQNRYYKIDRNSADYPVFKSLNSDGILTASPKVDIKKIKSGQQGYAQAIPITKCHWLTNLHVVDGIAKERNEKLQIGTEVFGSFGQGPSCEGNESFKVSGVSAKLVGYNPEAIEKGTGEILNQFDWAVVKSSRPLTEVPTAKFSKTDLFIQDVAVMTGTPVGKLDDQGFSVLGSEVVRAEKGSVSGLVTLSNQQSQPGKSGGGVYKIEENGLGLAAIFVGSGKALNLSVILKQMKKTNPALYEDIKRVIQGGDCN